MAGLTDSAPPAAASWMPQSTGFADVWPLPDAGLSSGWASTVLPAGMKEDLPRTAIAGVSSRRAVSFPALPRRRCLRCDGCTGAGRVEGGRLSLRSMSFVPAGISVQSA